VLRALFEQKENGIKEEKIKLHYGELRDLYLSPNEISVNN
jgi:hypothetical protein